MRFAFVDSVGIEFICEDDILGVRIVDWHLIDRDAYRANVGVDIDGKDFDPFVWVADHWHELERRAERAACVLAMEAS